MTKRKETTNKSLISEMVLYFMEQDKEVLCKILAGTMLDIHRFIIFEELPKQEADSLLQRCLLNSEEVCRFAKHGKPKSPLTYSIKNSDGT